MRLSRRKRFILFLCLALVILIGVFIIIKRHPAEFVDGFTVTCPTTDTIQVTGTRIPGGDGIWRYHIHADRWEEVPSRVINIPHLDKDHHEIPSERFPLDDGSVTLCQATDRPSAYIVGPDIRETKRFIQVQLRDGTSTELGVIAHAPQIADWGMLPDRSGFWVREERNRKDGNQVVIHLYSFQTHQWKIVYQSIWSCTYAILSGEPDSDPGCSMLRRHGDWVLVFHNADIYYPSSPTPVIAELWVNLTSGASRLGEPTSNPYLSAFSLDGQYCYIGDKIHWVNILSAPEWPQGTGVVGQTYSLSRIIGTLPKGDLGQAPEWTPDSRHLIYYSTNDSNGDPVLPVWMIRLLEHYTPYSFSGLEARLKYHIVDLSGKEVGSGYTYISTLVNEDHVLIELKSGGKKERLHYFLSPRSGIGKREIFQTIFLWDRHMEDLYQGSKKVLEGSGTVT